MTAIAALVLAIFAQAAELNSQVSIAGEPATFAPASIEPAAVAQKKSSGLLIRRSEVQVLPAAPLVCADLPTERERVICFTSSVFGDRSGAAVRIASCETGGKLNADAEGAAGERGQFQIHPIHIPAIEAMGMTWDDMYDPYKNAVFAYHLGAGGATWQPWSTRACAGAWE